ncbi:MAG: hypothetical protein Q4A21_01285 [bacterium]|nr:hypothetical protein [bacterium]
MNISDKSLFQIPNFEQYQKKEEKVEISTSLFDAPQTSAQKFERTPQENHILQDILKKSQEIIQARQEAEAFLRGR